MVASTGNKREEERETQTSESKCLLNKLCNLLLILASVRM